MDALKASLGGGSKAKPTATAAKAKAPAAIPTPANNVTSIGDAKVRKPVKRAPRAAEPVARTRTGGSSRTHEEVTVALPTASPFTLKRVQEMLGLSRTVVTGLVAVGVRFASPGPSQ